MKKTHVIYSNEVGAPGNKITEDNDLFFKLDEITDAENTQNAKYAHYYQVTTNDYDLTEFIYVETTNA
ncbi:hypothetical protein MXL46_08095 [Heyndrickxia sporothermodurans]|uniref:Uncharacterized protein n=1 Tax=Heyndrickxia sporothermodurans TaxID=46224 RepID=A0A150KS20_9BACI|nr:hypothetical protein [Heyndrickxia sporothermodurans]KYD02620.1 hypothetical protein B4102_0214 [Heyndrickxia sporothermodurans]MBL5768223.1 hypothetical protein [Heyndrickxia sporothermodurans]MBL5771002.1 hypothetical protein [Heyndrickxia sporothermodurans]MBL5774702.1 hypothetical protein [Heyndrickxia sporothermodurans]MBL5778104.1 hypothetical protein [Heyndrickxia sporothermodurans]